MAEPDYGNRIGIGDQAFRGQFAFSDYDFGKGAGYYTAAVAKVNGYVFGKYYSGSAGHAEHQALQELYKVTFAARRSADLFLEPPATNKLTIYVTKSPCSSTYHTTTDHEGCAEKILANTSMNGYDFEVKVRYGNLYVPRNTVSTYGEGPKERSGMAMEDLGQLGISTGPYNTGTKKVKPTTGGRGDPHPFRFIT